LRIDFSRLSAPAALLYSVCREYLICFERVMPMSSPKIDAVDIEASAALGTATQGNYKVFNRIVDWITSERMQVLNITDRINEVVRKSGIEDGIIHLQSLHTTTALFINEWQDALIQDVKTFLEQVVDNDQYYRHNDPQFSDCERSNADSHLRGMLMGQTLCLQVRKSAVLLGTWQKIIFAEFDGPRSRSLSVQISGI
jgi:secondary thiamine-phosphate synthase enzyme